LFIEIVDNFIVIILYKHLLMLKQGNITSNLFILANKTESLMKRNVFD